jgi:hypothetical protein
LADSAILQRDLLHEAPLSLAATSIFTWFATKTIDLPKAAVDGADAARPKQISSMCPARTLPGVEKCFVSLPPMAIESSPLARL